MRAHPVLVAIVVAAVVATAVLGVAAIGGVHRAVTRDAPTVAAILAEDGRATEATADAAHTGSVSTSSAPNTATPSELLRTPTAAPSLTPTATAAPTPAVNGLLALTYPRPAPEPVGEPGPRPAPTAINSELGRRLARITTAPALQVEAPVAVAVVDRWGRRVFASSPREPLLPASTNKLVVAAAALHSLGPDLRLRTAVAATGPVAEGVVQGDLVLVGGGDPALVSPRFAAEVYPDRPHTPIASLVDQLIEVGITAVGGRVLADPRLFAHELEPDGWPQRYLDRMEGTRIAALTVDAGRRLFVRERDGALLGEAAEDPAVQAAAVLTDLLQERGIEVGGGPALADVEIPHARAIAAVRSRPLGELLAHMVTHSDNHMADTLFRVIGAVEDDGTWAGSERAVRRILDDLRLNWADVRLADGSGLSRDNRLTAAFLAQLDERMMASPHAERWQALQAVGGRTGTLRARYRGTPADGVLFAKTGALQDVRALAGHTYHDGDRYSFAVIGAALEPEDIRPVRRLMDLVGLALAAETAGCGAWRPSPPPPDPGETDPAATAPDGAADGRPPPEEAVCPQLSDAGVADAATGDAGASAPARARP